MGRPPGATGLRTHAGTPRRCPLCFYFLVFIYLFLERGGEGEREGEKHQCERYFIDCSHMTPTGDLACHPGLCPDWELNRQPFGSQAGTQSTEPYEPGLGMHFFKKRTYCWSLNSENKLSYSHSFFAFFPHRPAQLVSKKHRLQRRKCPRRRPWLQAQNSRK